MKIWAFVCIGLALTFGIPNASHATSPTEAITLTGMSVDPVSPTKHVVTLSGTLTNSGSKRISRAQLSLTTSDPIFTRSQLKAIRDHTTTRQGTDVPAYGSLIKNLEPSATTSWSIRFVAERVFSTHGVYAVGVHLTAPNLNSYAYSTMPWFGDGSDVDATNVAVLVPITTLPTRLMKNASGPSVADAQELKRLRALSDGFAKSHLSRVVDTSVSDWLASFVAERTSSEFTAAVSSLTSNVTTMSESPFNLPYANADLASLGGARTEQDLSGLLALRDKPNTSTANPRMSTLYVVPRGSIDRATAAKLMHHDVIPILANTTTFGGAQTTTATLHSVNNRPLLIQDAGASDCLKDIFSEADFFQSVSCFTSEIGMMTAESPQASRTVLVVAPPRWNISAANLKKFESILTKQNGIHVTSLGKVVSGHAEGVPANFPWTRSVFAPQRIAHATHTLASQTNLISSLIGNYEWAQTFRRARYVAYSSHWQTQAHVLNYLRTIHHKLAGMTSAIQIQAAGRVTVSTTKTEIPITIGNFGNYPVRVRLILSANSAGQLTSTPSQLKEIPVGQRVTFPVQVIVKGTGVIHSTAEVLNSRGQRIGARKEIDISATAYQKIASILVKIAFGLLIILAVMNFIRRRRPQDKQADSDRAL